MDSPLTPQPVRKKKPVFGILSCAALLLIPLLYIIAFIVGFPGEAANAPGYQAGLSVANLVVFLFLATFGAGILSAIGLLFGILGLTRKHQGKVLAIIGTSLNGLLLLVFLLILIAIRLSRG